MFFIAEQLDGVYRLNAQPVLDPETQQETGEYTYTEIVQGRCILHGTYYDGRHIIEIPDAASTEHLRGCTEWLGDGWFHFAAKHQNLVKYCIGVELQAATEGETETKTLKQYESDNDDREIIAAHTAGAYLQLPE